MSATWQPGTITKRAARLILTATTHESGVRSGRGHRQFTTFAPLSGRYGVRRQRHLSIDISSMVTCHVRAVGASSPSLGSSVGVAGTCAGSSQAATAAAPNTAGGGTATDQWLWREPRVAVMQSQLADARRLQRQQLPRGPPPSMAVDANVFPHGTPKSLSDAQGVLVGYVTDVEGSGDYFERYLAISQVLGRDPVTQNLFLKDDPVLKRVTHFVFGGDLFDKGPNDLHLAEDLVALKQRYPSRVHLIVGNRDINKLKLFAELDPSYIERTTSSTPEKCAVDIPFFVPSGVPSIVSYGDFLKAGGVVPKKPPPASTEQRPPSSLAPLSPLTDNVVSRLRWHMNTTMGCPTTFELRRAELLSRKRKMFLPSTSSPPSAEQHDVTVTDDEVAESYRVQVDPSTVAGADSSRAAPKGAAAIQDCGVDVLEPLRGVVLRYLLLGQLVAVIGDTMFVHGAVNRWALGFVPDGQAAMIAATPGRNPERRFRNSDVALSRAAAAIARASPSVSGTTQPNGTAQPDPVTLQIKELFASDPDATRYVNGGSLRGALPPRVRRDAPDNQGEDNALVCFPDRFQGHQLIFPANYAPLEWLPADQFWQWKLTDTSPSSTTPAASAAHKTAWKYDEGSQQVFVVVTPTAAAAASPGDGGAMPPLPPCADGANNSLVANGSLLDEWVFQLNCFYQQGLMSWLAQPIWKELDPVVSRSRASVVSEPPTFDRFVRGGAALLMYGHQGPLGPRTVMVNNYLRRGQLDYVGVDTVMALAAHGVTRVVVGHQPAGDTPSVIRQPGLTVILADNSYCAMAFPNGRGQAVSEVLITDVVTRDADDESSHSTGPSEGPPLAAAYPLTSSSSSTCVLHGVRADGTRFRCDAEHPLVGRRLPDGRWTKLVVKRQGADTTTTTSTSTSCDTGLSPTNVRGTPEKGGAGEVVLVQRTTKAFFDVTYEWVPASDVMVMLSGSPSLPSAASGITASSEKSDTTTMMHPGGGVVSDDMLRHVFGFQGGMQQHDVRRRETDAKYKTKTEHTAAGSTDSKL